MMRKAQALSAFCAALVPAALAAQAAPDYPSTRRDAIVETVFGQPIADPYRWL